ncbi:MAG: type II toxin-antitoxin system RelE/ParE family toxin [Verrucomicrobiota bacterium]
MEIVFTPRFAKQYRKLTAEQQTAADEAIRKFQQDPFQVSLRNHPLKGKLESLRAIKAGYDLRLIYEEYGGHVVIHFVAVGSHDEVY